MNQRRSFLIVSAVLLVQLLAGLAWMPGSVAAQDAEGVYVVENSTREADCNVVYTTYKNADYTSVISRSDPVPCQGGVVWAYRTTRGEAGARRATMAVERRVVPITGNKARDREAVRSQIAALQSANERKTASSLIPVGPTLGFAHPHLFAAPGSEATRALPANYRCQNSSVPEYRSALTTFRANRPNTDVRTRVYYKRVTCSTYRITSVASILTDPPKHRVNSDSLQYDRVYDASRREYRRRTFVLGCPRLNADFYKYSRFRDDAPSILPNYGVIHEVIDDEFFDPGCTQLGNSYTSVKFYLRGYTR